MTIVEIIFNVSGHLRDIYHTYFPSYPMETAEEVYSLEKADEILGNNNKVSIYYGGIMYFALFSNRSNDDRIITQFTVNAENIVPDTKPVTSTIVSIHNNQLVLSMYNSGWGPATRVLVETKPNNATLSEMLGVNSVFSGVDILNPGQTAQIVCINHEDLNLDYLMPTEQTQAFE